MELQALEGERSWYVFRKQENYKRHNKFRHSIHKVDLARMSLHYKMYQLFLFILCNCIFTEARNLTFESAYELPNLEDGHAVMKRE